MPIHQLSHVPYRSEKKCQLYIFSSTCISYFWALKRFIAQPLASCNIESGCPRRLGVIVLTILQNRIEITVYYCTFKPSYASIKMKLYQCSEEHNIAKHEKQHVRNRLQRSAEINMPYVSQYANL